MTDDNSSINISTNNEVDDMASKWLADKKEVADARRRMSQIRDIILQRMAETSTTTTSKEGDDTAQVVPSRRIATDQYTASVLDKTRKVIPSHLHSSLTSMRNCRLVQVKDKHTGEIVLKWRCSKVGSTSKSEVS